MRDYTTTYNLYTTTYTGCDLCRGGVYTGSSGEEFDESATFDEGVRGV
jgi:hypothetical protein